MVQKRLHQTGFGDVFVRLHNRSNKRKPPLFVLAVATSGNQQEKKKVAEKISELLRLLGFKIQVEPLPAGMGVMPQCFKCQDEGCIAKFCRKESRCVKCAGKQCLPGAQRRKTDICPL